MKHEVCGLELLHLHTTEGSLLDGFGFVSEYANRWKGFGDYLCISDHGMMSAIPSQIRHCKATNDAKDQHKDKSLIPIFASELYVNPLQIQYHNEKEFKDYQKTLDPDQLKSLRKSYHLLAVAHSEVGYSNLVTLSSLAWIHGFYYRPRVNHELLMQYKEGITFTSCCYASEVGQAFDKGGEEAGFAMIEKYMAMFGEHYCLEFMLLDFSKQKPYNQFIMRAKDKYKLPIIVTTDTHYCNKEDSHNQRLMLMVQTKNTIQDIQKKIEDAGSQDLFELQDTNLWQKSEDELNEKWESDYSDVIDYELFKEAKRTTVEICRKAGGVKLDRSMKLPQIPDADDKLREAVFQGFKNRDLPQNKVYGNRLREEFELIFSKGFSSYFLILKATIDEARRYSMEVFGHPNVIGPGRGCLAPNVNIVLANGKFKNIKDIEVGDKVISDDGSVNTVLDKLKYDINEELLCVKSYYGDNSGVTLTKDHKILVEKCIRPANYSNWSYSTKTSVKSIVEPVGSLEWVAASDVTIGDWVFVPSPSMPIVPFDSFDLSTLQHDKTVLTFDDEYVYQGKLNLLTKKIKPVLRLKRMLEFNDDTYRILGMFAGDGWWKSNDSSTEVGFAFNRNDKAGIDFLINFMDKIGIPVKIVEHPIKKLTQCKIYSRHFQLFVKYCFPEYRCTPHTKHVPFFVFNQGENRKRAFLKGYLSADGHVAQYKCNFSTVSENLASQTRFLCWQVGIPASLCFNNRIDKRNGRKSVEIKVNIPHHYSITESRDGQECFYRKIDNGFLMRVRSIEKISGVNEVYDLNVENQHNYLTTSFQVHNSDVGSLLCYCLRITNVDPIQHDLLFSRFLSKARNDLPDADVDFLPQVRDYLKNDWAPSYFGRDNVANIGSYNTFGIKSSLIDMARVHNKDRNEVLNLTTKLGLKDDDGNVLTWDKALEIYPELKKYCEENPDVAASAKKLINRSRSMGKHAGGIIISSQPINKFVPLVRGKEGEIVSSWTEGLHDQDLGPMGFVKYDWLVITNLEQINYACKVIKERYGLTGICNKPEQEDWSDTSFLNDPASIAMANEADLKGIFQFDSDGIRHLARKGGVNVFNDLVAYASLYRPGPMSEGMHDEYCDRKKGIKEFTIHELLKPVLETTYGVICYQEQCMKILHVVGDIPLEDCEILRKAISKKKEEYFAKYKVMFIQNGMKNLGWTEEEVINLWKLLEAFAGYAFNLCLTGDMFVKDKISNKFYQISDLENHCDKILLDSCDGVKLIEDELMDVFCTGEQEVFEIQLDSGITIKSTLLHKFYCSDGKPYTVQEILGKDLEVFFKEDFQEYMQKCKIKSVKSLGVQKTYNLTMKSAQHNYAVYDQNKDKFVISRNSHACAYTYISSMLLWLKSHYPLEFYTAILHFENNADKIKEYRLDAQRHDIVINPLDLNKSRTKFDITDNEIYFGFANVKGVGEVAAQRIVDNQPYVGFHDFLVRFGTDESVIKPLIGLGIFKKDGEPGQLYSHYKWFKDIKDKLKARDSRFKDSCKRNVEAAIAFGLEINEHTDIFGITDSREEVQALVKKHQRMVDTYNKKESVAINEHTYKLALLDGSVTPTEMDEKLVALFASPEECEMQFYGFLWNHPICKSPDYEGKRTFDIYKEKGLQQGYVEVMISSVTKQTSKKNTNYWLVKAEDANGEVAQIQVWEDDWIRFKDDLKAGEYVKMEVKAPDKGFYRYTLFSPPKWLRHKLVAKTRDADMRVWVLRKPELPE